MNTTAAAAEATVTVATIRAWCRRGVIAAVKVAGRWIIDAASLARRIEIGVRRMTDPIEELGETVVQLIRRARLGYSPRPADREALAGRYVLPSQSPVARSSTMQEQGLVDVITVGSRSYWVLSDKAVRIRAQLAAN
jgi:hypothetical protein